MGYHVGDVLHGKPIHALTHCTFMYIYFIHMMALIKALNDSISIAEIMYKQISLEDLANNDSASGSKPSKFWPLFLLKRKEGIEVV